MMVRAAPKIAGEPVPASFRATREAKQQKASLNKVATFQNGLFDQS